MTLDELLAASDEDKAVWLCGKLFDMITCISSCNYVVLNKLNEKHILLDKNDWGAIGSYKNLVDWLSSLEGIDAIERAMIERGWECVVMYLQGKYSCGFEMDDMGAIAKDVKKSVAMQNAVIKTLWDKKTEHNKMRPEHG